MSVVEVDADRFRRRISATDFGDKHFLKAGCGQISATAFDDRRIFVTQHLTVIDIEIGCGHIFETYFGDRF